MSGCKFLLDKTVLLFIILIKFILNPKQFKDDSLNQVLLFIILIKFILNPKQFKDDSLNNTDAD